MSSILEKEEALSRELSSAQLAMIAIGGAIGTGLFLGSALAVRLAGPGVILTYVIGAVVAVLLMGALSEMAVAHPTAGSFGVYAEIYVSRWAGFVVRYTYWFCQVIAIGGEATAVAIYCQWWLPHIPQWVFIVGFSAALVYVNASSVGNFGAFEYWFAMIKVVAIVLVIIVGIGALAGLGPAPAIGLVNYTAHGGFLPKGWSGVWMAIVFVIFGYLGTEVVAVTSGEARDPQTAVPRALKSMVGRLIVFYLGAVVVLIGIVPWDQIQPGSDITASPFVKVFQYMGIPAAAHFVNFVVLTAALSSMNCNLYLVTRMIFSLSRGGYAPKAMGRVTARGVPLNALLISSAGLALATGVAIFSSNTYVLLFGVALYGGLFTWLMIFVTHLYFRPRSEGKKLPVRMIGYPYTSWLGVAFMLAIMGSTWFVEGMRITLQSGAAWMVFISVAYLLWRQSFNAAASAANHPGE
jgi:AAT family amino acid transporter